MKEKKPNPPELVTTAWIVSILGVHQSTIEPAWLRGDLEVFAHVYGGKGKTRPIFEKSEAIRWEKKRARKDQ